MNRQQLCRLALISTLALGLGACAAGGGESGTGNNGSNTTINTPKDISVGTITGFGAAPANKAVSLQGVAIAPRAAAGTGSIIVNGIQFDVSATDVSLDGTASDTATLALGQVVTIKGTINADGQTGSAAQVAVERAIKGTVGSVGTNTLVVMGQNVQVTETTKLDGNISFDPIAGLEGLTVGDSVAVSGYVRDAGAISAISATRLEKIGALSEYKVKGYISYLNANAKTFQIGQLTVDYASVAAGALPVNGISNNQFVKVKGTWDGALLAATEIEAEKLEVEEADNMELEGFIGNVSGADPIFVFAVNNVPVVTNANTLYEGGLPSEIAAGTRIEIKGALSSGVVSAAKIAFKDSVKLQSAITGLITTANTFGLAGFPGITVEVNDLTEIDSDTGHLTDFKDGDGVKVRGYVSGSGNIVATKIESGSNTEVVLQGPMDSCLDTSLVIMGVQIDLNASIELDLDSEDGATTVGFCPGSISPNDIIKAEGQLQIDQTILWTSVDLEQ